MTAKARKEGRPQSTVEDSKDPQRARTLLLLDGHSLAYRAFYALPVENFSTSTGQHTNAIYGFASMLINLLAQEQPDQVIVAFDVSRKTFRSERFPDYKANRARTPDEFRSQLSFISEILAAFGIPVVEREGYEADDLIATITKAALVNDPSAHVLITTGDRDAFQLVRPGVTVLYPKKGVTDLARMDETAVAERYGISPQQYPDFAALRGDPSDNLPSIPGVGEKTAVKWIQEYGSLSSLIAAADQIPGKVGQSLREALPQLLLNRELTQLIDEVPIETEVLSELIQRSWSGIDARTVKQIFEDLEIKTLSQRLDKLPQRQGATLHHQALHLDDDPDLELPASRTLDVTVKKVSEKELSEIPAGEYALHLSTRSGASGLLALSPSEKEVFWAEVADPVARLSAVLAAGSIRLFGHGLKSLLRGIDPKIEIEPIFDTELALYLLNPGQRDLELESAVASYCGYSQGAKEISGDGSREEPSGEEETSHEVKRSEQQLELFIDSTFDPVLAAYLWPLRSVLTENLLASEQLELLHRIEIPLTVILARMEDRGIAFDLTKASALRDLYRHEVDRASENAFTAAGREFNVNSPKQLQVILFEELKLPKTKRIKSGFSTDADSLLWLYEETKHPFLTALLRIREVSKLATVIDGLISSCRGGRIHTTFQQTVTATGRLSSIDPNLQNIPIRSDEGRKIRECFVPSGSFASLMTADYSQIEMRIMAHLSQDQSLIEAFASGEDLHNSVGARVFGVATDQVTPDMRRTIKAMSYGLAYGLSAYGLAQQLDLSPGKAQQLMDDYFARFGRVRDYLQEVVREARTRGYTETLLGRRRYLPDLSSENRQRREMAERMALNAPIQGSAADIIKLAMIAVEREIDAAGLQSRMILQVHDELIMEVAPGEEESLKALVVEAMGEAFTLNVALEVNVGVGESWEAAAH